jgi:hypothetical protein
MMSLLNGALERMVSCATKISRLPAYDTVSSAPAAMIASRQSWRMSLKSFEARCSLGTGATSSSMPRTSLERLRPEPRPLRPYAAVTIWREGDQLLWRPSGKNTPSGAIEIYPEAETNFFVKLGATLTFTKNDQGEATALDANLHAEGWPEIKAMKVKP